MTSIQERRELAAGSAYSGQAWAGTVRRAERNLLERVGSGEVLDLLGDAPPDEDRTPLDLEVMRTWGADRTISADLLRHLLVETEWPVHAKGVRLRGAVISGALDLDSATLRCPVVLEDCYLSSEQPAVLDNATLSGLRVVRCRLAGLTAVNAVVTKELNLGRSTLTGAVLLSSASVTGQLSCRGAQLTGVDEDGYSLVAEGITVGGDLLLDDGFTSAGALSLPGGRITGKLICSDAHLDGSDEDGDALVADGVTVGRDVFLNDTFTAAGAVRLLGATIGGQLNCRGAQLTAANLDGNALVAERTSIGGHVFLGTGFAAAGCVSLPGAAITGQLNCRGAQLTGTNQDGNSLVAERATIGGHVFIDEDFTSVGTVQLAGATIGGQLNFSGAQLTGTQLHSLAADGLTVGGDMVLDDGFAAAGAVSFPGSRITGQLICTGAQLTGVDGDGDALVADGIAVGRDVFLDGTFAAAGAVRLLGATITGELNCGGARFGTNRAGDSLVAEGITVGRDIFLDDAFTAAGAVGLAGARISGGLFLGGATLASPVALVADGARISQALLWAPATTVVGLVSLERMQLHRLDDDWSTGSAHWPGDGQLRLAGFVYDGFGGEHQATWTQRLGWIRGQHRRPGAGGPGRFDAQPYEQLARVYRQAGHDTEARRISIARRSDLRTYGSLNRWRRTGNWLLDVTIKHGYQPLRAVGMLAALYLVALLLFWGAQHQDGAMVPVKDPGSGPAPTATVCTADYPCFYPTGYAIDVTIPIVKVGQAEYWRPNGAADGGWAYVAGTWVITGLGWAFTTLAVAGYTGLVRKD